MQLTSLVCSTRTDQNGKSYVLHTDVVHTPLPQYPMPFMQVVVVGRYLHELVQQGLGDEADPGEHWLTSWQFEQQLVVSSHCSPVSTTPLPHVGETDKRHTNRATRRATTMRRRSFSKLFVLLAPRARVSVRVCVT